MKKITIISLVSLCAAGVYAQGTLSFSDTLSGDNSSVYAPQTAGMLTTGPLAGETVGNTSTQSPAGTQAAYTGVPIGGQNDPNGGTPSAAPYTSYQYGNNYSVAIYWTPESGNIAANRLVAGSTFLPGYYAALLTPQAAWNSVTFTGQGNGNPAPAYVGTMATSSTPGAGFFQSGAQSQVGGLYGDVQTQADAAGNNASGNPQNDTIALVALACWYNAGNTITSYAMAQAAGNVPYGISLPALENALGESQTDWTDMGNGGIPNLPEGLKITSFSLVNPVPEPSTIALGVMGVCAFLARRRMK